MGSCRAQRRWRSSWPPANAPQRPSGDASHWQLDFRVMLAVGNEELDPELNGIYERPGG
ncbi:MAG TPA: hypothetical protein VGG41_07910 [Solirubrobacteraceae bacterium]|jgi:hypothetical protein